MTTSTPPTAPLAFARARAQSRRASRIFVCVVLLLCGACAAEGGSPDLPSVQSVPVDPVLGPDADADGVRDDLGEHIRTTFAGDPDLQRAARQYARALRDGLAAPLTRDASVAAVTRQMRAMECMRARGSALELKVMSGHIAEIRARAYDTWPRTDAYHARHRLIGSMHYAFTRGDDTSLVCDPEPTAAGTAP